MRRGGGPRFLLDSATPFGQRIGVRACVIFNPTARGEKAKRFRRHLDAFGSQCSLKLTATAGDARRLAKEAVLEENDTVVAAGGDGTLNEVLNGIGDAPDGFQRVRLGILPLGTVNVFARELGIPTRLDLAWKVITDGTERRIDLPCVSHQVAGRQSHRYFAQLAGAGLDARAIELVKWQVKKRIGPLAYILAGLHAVMNTPTKIQALAGGGNSAEGELVLVGNGRLYGGQFVIFPQADLADGLLEICVVPRVNWLTLTRCAPQLLVRGRLPASMTKVFRTNSLTLSSPSLTPLEVDGELIGHLPAQFSLETSRLRVAIPRP